MGVVKVAMQILALYYYENDELVSFFICISFLFKVCFGNFEKLFIKLGLFKLCQPINGYFEGKYFFLAVSRLVSREIVIYA